MSRQVQRLLLSVLLLTNISQFVIAQNQTQPPLKPKPEEEKAANELLQSIAAGVPNLRSSSNRVIIGCAVADLLWERDQKQAREIFEAAVKEIATSMSRLDFDDQEDFNMLSYLQQQRQRILEVISRHDAALALKFLKDTRPQFSSDKRGGNFADQERALELSLASQVAARDPEFALKIARESLKRGVSYGQVAVLTQLQQKDAPSAQAFYSEIVDRLASDDLPETSESFNVGWNLLSTYQPPQAREEAFRRLINTLSSRVLELNPSDPARLQIAQNLYHQMRYSLQIVEKFAPDKAQLLRDWTKLVERTFDPSSRMYAELNDIAQEGSLEDVLALTSRYPEEMHSAIYQHAVWKALNSGELDRARELAKQSISDPIQLKQLLNQIESHLAWKSTNDGHLAEARKHFANVKNPEQRIQMMTQLASNLSSKGDKEGALGLLIEARTFLESVPQSNQKMSAQLQLIRSYCSLAPQEAEEMLQPFIAHLNQLIAAAVVLDGLDNRYLQEGEWLVQGYFSLNGLVNNLDQALAQLASVDKHFSTAQTLASQFERPEIRMYAQLTIVQSVLRDKNPNVLRLGNISVSYPQRTFISN